jgi:hypothetical protein
MALPDIGTLLGKLPPEAIPFVLKTVKEIAKSPDPVTAAKLAAMAAAGKMASHAAADEILKRVKR